MIDVSIIIPVKNGGQLFKMVLEGIHKQNFDGTYEVICVDSGSTDQSKQNILRNNFKLYERPETLEHLKEPENILYFSLMTQFQQMRIGYLS